MMLSKAFAFLRRDFLGKWSYKFGFVYEVASVFSSVLTLYFVSRLFAKAPPETVAAYNTDYFTFTLIGLAFLDYMWVSMRSFAQQVRMAQFMGTLEAMLASPTSPFLIILGSAVYPYVWTTFRSFIFLLLGTALFGATFPHVHIGSVLVFLLLIIMTFGGIGVASAAMTLYLKQSDPLSSLIGGISFLFGGIMYPVQSLPLVLQKIAWVLPMTHAVEGLRRALLFGESPLQLSTHALFLLAWALVSFVLASFALTRVLRILSNEGSQGAY